MHKRVIDGRFELVERLGGGGMGLVWRAWDVALHREVALKEVRPPDPSMDEQDPAGARDLRARVLREARALARLNHPHVATIHHIVDPGEHDYPWIVMELVPGGSLQDRIQHGAMPPEQVAKLGREVLSALRAAHAVGIQHRDVKPANVLLREDGRSVLTDFGIAAVRESTSLTATGSFIGSPEYMAPERINGVEGDPASDLWSLGMMLYVAVEGRHPLRRSTTLATLAAVLNADVPPAERAGPLGPVLAALLTRDTAVRPDAETLDRMLAAAESGHTPPPPHPYAPHAPGPQSSGPQAYAPQGPGSQPPAPHDFGSHGSGPHRAGSQGSGPHGAGPYGAGSQGSGPHGAGHHGTGPHGAGAQSGGPGWGAAVFPPGGNAGGPIPPGSGPYGSGPSGPGAPGAGPGAYAGPPQAGNTVPPQAGHTVPPGHGGPWGKAPVSHADTMNRRRPRRGGTALVAVIVSVVVVVGVVGWRLLPAIGDLGGDGRPQTDRLSASDAPNTGRTPRVTTTDDTTGDTTDDQTGDQTGDPSEETVEENLLTPAGMRAMIAKLKPAIGGTKVVKMVVYPTYASVDAPLKRDSDLYDSYDYRDGAVSEPRKGGQVRTGTTDLSKYNWNALPNLIKRAKKDLGASNPTTVYVIVDPNYVFTATKQVLLVYASDDYGRGGYLVADPQGKVLRLVGD
ncbi:protein kinase [Nonomuraea sp. NPDC048882]|uniref:serine/threonine-protein kinase n=1 Tax=Nonomuraea sp. NPDC048882 TaxID=3154347 RepID=UPI0033D3BDDF